MKTRVHEVIRCACVNGKIRQCNKLKSQMAEEQLSYYDLKTPPSE
jgi:hypothetical protein